MGSSRQEYWSGLPCPPPGDLPDPGVELASLVSPALAGGFFTNAPLGKPCPHTPPTVFETISVNGGVLFFKKLHISTLLPGILVQFGGKVL